MITLYVKSNCPYSLKAIAALDVRNIPYTLKNIADPAVAQELIDIGGKRKVPFLEDDAPCDAAQHLAPCLLQGEVQMYESDDIVKYIEENYR